jgi:GTPase involved in cell partitioning and DNA repair
MGTSGKGDKNHGTDGKDIHYTVPLGTEIFEIKHQTT